MTKKRKLGSKNPKYQTVDTNAPKEIKRTRICNVVARDASGNKTDVIVPASGVWYE